MLASSALRLPSIDNSIRKHLEDSRLYNERLHGPSQEFLPRSSTTQSSAFTPGHRKFISPVLYLTKLITKFIDQYWLLFTSDQSPCFHRLRRIEVKKKITSLPRRACRRNHPRRWTKATCQEPEKSFEICFVFSALACNHLLHLLHVFKMLCHQVLVQEPILRGGPKAHWREEEG